MAVQRTRADVQPVGWEVPVACSVCWLLLVVMLLPAAQGAAGWLFAGGFVWPHGSAALMQSVAGLLTGEPGRGLAVNDAAHLAPTAVIYLLIVLSELMLNTMAVWMIVLWWRRLGPGARQGMAGRAEVKRVLGSSNLRARRTVIRPDLHHDKPRKDRRSRT